MNRFRSILVATDFSPAATHAVRRAALIASHHRARLSLLHVVDGDGCDALRRLFARDVDLPLKTAQTRASLARLASEIVGRHGIDVDVAVTAGDAFEDITRASASADLLVLGARRAGALRGRVVGGTAERLVRTCRTPVLVVKDERTHGSYRRILVPLDFTPCSPAALAIAAGLADDARVHAFHAREAGDSLAMHLPDVPLDTLRQVREMEEEQARWRMHEMAARLRIAPGRVAASVGRGDAASAALREALAVDADLVVAGKQGRSTLADFLLGSVTRQLLRQARCDVMVIPRAAVAAARGAHAARTGPARPMHLHGA